MLGTVRLAGEEHRIRLDLRVRADRVLRPWATTRARTEGRLRIAGLADDPHTTGELEISPLARRRIRYRLSFTAGGRRLDLDGWKSVTPVRPVASMTVLPFTVYEEGARVGEGTLRFPLATGLVPFLASFRFPHAERPGQAGAAETAAAAAGAAGAGYATGSGQTAYDRHMAPRWDGTAGRTEVWYTTLTDPETGTGIWLHHELTAPADGSRAFAHGWVAAFPHDGPPRHARFGPVPWPEARTNSEPDTEPDTEPKSEPETRAEGGEAEAGTGIGFAAAGVLAAPGRLAGTADGFSWNLTEHPEAPPLFTFPRWSWRRPLLPAAQMLPTGRASYDGEFTHDGHTLALRDAHGASARIYGHGNARRWAWLHADLGNGDVLEIVAAVSTRPGLRALPPLVFLRLRQGDRTWPRRVERGAVGWMGPGRFRARIGLPTWTVSGRAGLRRIRVEVTQPPDRTLALDYRDPDGSPAVCRNSETADAEVLVERWRGRWRREAQWSLKGTAHAEVGDR
ncbi:hypothetical protein [Streptomyces sp. GC420]|uniref:hypothetical protein n=1 Tax=Streptomyces sp. GC420 TaxID=2697568 RepID=UPI001AA1A439